MNTTELIELLKNLEHGGVTNKPRKISIKLNDTIYSNVDMQVIATGDGCAGAEILIELKLN